MLYKDICKVTGYFLFGLSATFVIPLFLSLYYQFFDESYHPQPYASIAFLESLCTCFLFGFILFWIGRRSKGNLYRREGLIVVVAVWLITPAITALPFLLTGTLTNPYQAYFETTSGLTTTGSTILQAKKYDPITGVEIPIKTVVKGVMNTHYEYYGTVAPIIDVKIHKVIAEGIEAVSRELLFWRSFIQFLGGGGIIVLFVAILPILGVGGKVLVQTEVTGPTKESLTPRIKEGALQVWKIYLGLTLLQTILLMWTNSAMPFFDALTISFTTLATGGFSIKNDSIGFYHNANTEWVIIVFMLLGSINFTLYHYVLKGKIYRLYESELLLYLSIITITSLLCSWFLIGQEKILLNGLHAGTFNFTEAIRQGFFNIVSAESTTGFATVDYELWPYITQVMLLIVMFIGGMSGSTAGGIKIIRINMLFKIAKNKIESLFRPETVTNLRIGTKAIDQGTILRVLVFFFTIIFISVVGTIAFVIDGVDPETSLGLVACMINNIGLAFRAAGPSNSCAFLSDFSLVVSSLLMILGRLEFFAVLALLVPTFWKQTR